jgi:hypothetical protein
MMVDGWSRGYIYGHATWSDVVDGASRLDGRAIMGGWRGPRGWVGCMHACRYGYR